MESSTKELRGLLDQHTGSGALLELSDEVKVCGSLTTRADATIDDVKATKEVFWFLSHYPPLLVIAVNVVKPQIPSFLS